MRTKVQLDGTDKLKLEVKQVKETFENDEMSGKLMQHENQNLLQKIKSILRRDEISTKKKEISKKFIEDQNKWLLEQTKE